MGWPRNMLSKTRPMVPVLLDNWESREKKDSNTIAPPHPPVWDLLWKKFPRAPIKTSRASVGNIERGHPNLGAGCLALGMTLLFLWIPQVFAEDRQQRLEVLEQRIDSLQQTLESTREHKDQARKQLEQSERRMGRLAKDLRESQRELQERGETLQQLQVKRELKQRQVTRQRGLLAGQLRSAYIMGRQERLKLLLTQEVPGRLSRIMAYHEYLSRERTHHIRDMERQMTELLSLEQEVSDQRQVLNLLLARQEMDQQQLEADSRLHRSLVKELDTLLRATGTALRGARQDARNLSALLDRLEQQALQREKERRKPIKEHKGRLDWPVKGRLAFRFGTQRASGGLSWDGVVINAPEGRDVRAVHHGRVAFADWLRGFGLLLILDHGGGYMSLYGFNQTLLKETGEWVDEGETLALVGTSGGRTRPGVYFGIREAGRPQNPQRWCKGLKQGRTG